MAYRTANGIMGLLFLGAAALQYNDPDAFRWIFVYSLAALLCALAVRGEVPVRPVLGYAAVSALLATGTALVAGGEGTMDEEVVREVLGLGWIALWMAVLWAWTRRVQDPEEDR